MNDDQNQRGLPSLISDLIQQLTSLVQTEGQLLRQEVKETGRKISGGAVGIALGAVLLVAAVVILLQALVQALAQMGLGEAWASLIVGLAAGVIGYIVLQRAAKVLSPEGLAPSRTAEQLRQDANLVKEQTR